MINILVVSLILLSLEKMCYVYVFNHPAKFKNICERLYPHPYSPVKVLGYCLTLFKIIQINVFIYWWQVTTGLNIFNQHFNWLAGSAGILLIVTGQFLNFSVFQQIGNTGVLYGRQFGYPVPWVTGFPYSLLKHPQYVGTLISIWGAFLLMNYNYQYWYALPLMETVLYILGAEQEHVA